jgi:hypothetical protein
MQFLTDFKALSIGEKLNIIVATVVTVVDVVLGVYIISR